MPPRSAHPFLNVLYFVTCPRYPLVAGSIASAGHSVDSAHSRDRTRCTSGCATRGSAGTSGAGCATGTSGRSTGRATRCPTGCASGGSWTTGCRHRGRGGPRRAGRRLRGRRRRWRTDRRIAATTARGCQTQQCRTPQNCASVFHRNRSHEEASFLSDLFAVPVLPTGPIISSAMRISGGPAGPCRSATERISRPRRQACRRPAGATPAARSFRCRGFRQ